MLSSSRGPASVSKASPCGATCPQLGETSPSQLELAASRTNSAAMCGATTAESRQKPMAARPATRVVAEGPGFGAGAI